MDEKENKDQETQEQASPQQKPSEKYVILETEPEKGQEQGKTYALTDDVNDLLANGPQKGKSYVQEIDKNAPLGKKKVKLLDVRHNDNPMVAFVRNLYNHLDAFHTGHNVKAIFVVGGDKMMHFFDMREHRFIPQNNRSLTAMEYKVSDLKREQDLVEKGKAVDPTKVDWDYLKSQFGVDGDKLEREGQMDKLLHFQQTDAVDVTLPPKEGYDKGFATKVRFSLSKQTDGEGYRTHFVSYSNEVNLEQPFMGHEWTPEQRKTLMQSGNLGEVVQLTTKRGETNDYYVSVDPQTNRLAIARAEYVDIPKKVANVELSEEQQQELRKGKMIRVEGLRGAQRDPKTKKVTYTGVPYDTYLQINAEKRGLEFIFDPSKDFKQRFAEDESYRQRQRETQTKFAGIPEKIYGKELSDKQRFALGYGQAIYLENMPKKDGTTYNTWYQVDEKGKLRQYNHNPTILKDKMNEIAYGKDRKEAVGVKKAPTVKQTKNSVTKTKGIRR